MKFAIIGDGAVGKNNLLRSFIQNQFQYRYMPTTFTNEFHITIAQNNQQSFNLILTDTSGSSGFNRIRCYSYVNVDVFIVCYSVENHFSLNNVVNRWIPEMRGYKSDVPFILVGTKCDLNNALSERADEIVKQFNARSHVLCSAVYQFNVKRVFHEAVRVALENDLNK
ncbi:Rac/Rho-like_protein [Hexamita inflata]|uniref:Rac/Rho-like protein n=1 Tax=Hexamita inflata TaxID=28002 RepID=A0AA86RSR2_9EUKA|nr:Rac/Rho-like protein [Hexamita inflata]